MGSVVTASDGCAGGGRTSPFSRSHAVQLANEPPPPSRTANERPPSSAWLRPDVDWCGNAAPTGVLLADGTISAAPQRGGPTLLTPFGSAVLKDPGWAAQLARAASTSPDGLLLAEGELLRTPPGCQCLRPSSKEAHAKDEDQATRSMPSAQTLAAMLRCVDLGQSQELHGYRSVYYCLPTEWVSQYIDDHSNATPEGGYGLVSSVQHSLDALWPNYNRHQGPSFATLHQRIDCWDIPTDSNRWVFWNGGWGAPHRVMLNAMKMVSLHFGAIKDEYTGKCDSSDGDENAFGHFILGLMYGLRLPNDHGDGPTCELSVSVANNGSVHRQNATWGCDEDGDTTCKFKACEDIGPDYLEKSGKSCSLKDWDDWETPRWDSLRRIWTPGNVTTPWAQWCAFKAVQFGGTAISFAPSWVAWV